jgi:hypothetical protein
MAAENVKLILFLNSCIFSFKKLISPSMTLLLDNPIFKGVTTLMPSPEARVSGALFFIYVTFILVKELDLSCRFISFIMIFSNLLNPMEPGFIIVENFVFSNSFIALLALYDLENIIF